MKRTMNVEILSKMKIETSIIQAKTVTIAIKQT
jgi:hypothetical protein